MIFYNWALLLLVILLLFLGIIGVSAEIILDMLRIVCIIFLLKNVLQDFYFVFIKYKKKLSTVLAVFLTDCLRIVFFYRLIYYAALRVTKGMGMDLLGGIFSYILAVLIGGTLFIVGEINSIGLCTEESFLRMFALAVFFCGGLAGLYFVLI